MCIGVKNYKFKPFIETKLSGILEIPLNPFDISSSSKALQALLAKLFIIHCVV